jgi:hypothetical protein
MLARPVLLASAAAAGLLTLTACGGSSSSSESTSAAVSATPSASASGSTDTGTDTSGGAGGNADFEAYRSCLADNGVTLPSGGPGNGQGGPGGDGGTPPSGMPSGGPGGDGGTPPSGMPSGGPVNGQGGGFIPDGVDESTWEAAQQACASLAPTGGFGGGGGGQGGPADLTALQAYISCLSDHGVTVPEGEDPLRTLDRSDATVSAAMDTCAPLLPQRGDDTSAAPSSS